MIERLRIHSEDFLLVVKACGLDVDYRDLQLALEKIGIIVSDDAPIVSTEAKKRRRLAR